MNFASFFKNLRVVELSNVLAGPAVGQFFAESGAEVLKFENRATQGDVTRSWKLPTEEANQPESAYFACVNHNKKHQWVSFHDPKELNDVKMACRHADIVISNLKSEDGRRYQLDYDHLKVDNPGLIFGWIYGFYTQPDRVAYDVVLQAETGWMSMNGMPDGSPCRMPVAVIDLFAAHQLKEGLLVALLHKLQTGVGSKVQVSLELASLASLANRATEYLIAGQIPKKEGGLHPTIAPYGEVWICGDGKPLVLAVGNDRQFKDLCDVLGLEDMATDVRFSTNPQRVKNRRLLYDRFAAVFQEQKAGDWLIKMQAQEVPAAEIKNLQEVLDPFIGSEWMMKDTLGIRPKTTIFEWQPG